jgi:hypothetical protein
MKKSHFMKSLLPLGLALAIHCGGTLPSAIAQSAPARISIVVVEGEGAVSAVRQRLSRDPVVRVEDDDNRPVDGATVVFVLPVSGTTGEFPNGSKTLTVVTGKDGVAVATAIRANQVPGTLQIYVTASYQGLRARSLVTQTVEAAAGTKPPSPELRTSKSGGKWKWVILGLAAAGGTGAGIYFGRNTTPSPVSVSTGAVVFGSPQ